MTIHCNRCGTPVLGADVNIAKLVARCVPCNSIFGFEHALPVRSGPPMRAPLVVPDGLTIQRAPAQSADGSYRDASAHAPKDQLVLARSWRTPQVWFEVFFCLTWNAFLFFWYSKASSGAPWIFYVFPLGHVAVGVSMTFKTLRTLLNRTLIEVDATTLRVRTTPIGWRAPRAEVPSAEVAQVFIATGGALSAKAKASYAVMAQLKDGSSVELIRRLDRLDHAQYIEHAIDRHLDLVDVPNELSVAA